MVRQQKQSRSASAQGALLSRHFLQPNSREEDMSEEKEREEGEFYGGNGRKEDVEEVKSESLAADDGGPAGGSFLSRGGAALGQPDASSSWRHGQGYEVGTYILC